MPDQKSNRTWARLIAQVYEVDPLECPRCHSSMKVIAVITEPEEVKKILRYLVKIGPGRAADPHQGWAPPAGSELRVITKPSPCLLRGMSMSP